ncbi:diguanylate cyclase [Fusobacterium sp. MFO224]|uniref:diguanylate cyclase n=1 Tax=Fusobacterium sp. MFO224 TaxID=3378070 RepID=UPI003851ACAA
MSKKYIRLILIICIYIFFLFNFSFAKKYKDLRVGFYNIESEMEEASCGNNLGYNYYYLQQMKKYSNFRYKYIYGTWSQCLKNLENGKIDILVGIIKTPEREKKISFSKYSIGVLEGVMVASIREEPNFKKFKFDNTKKIGTIKGDFLGEKYEEIAKLKNYKNEINYYKDCKELWNNFYNNKFDIALTYNSSILFKKDKNIKIVDYFDPQFTYIAVKKGNEKLLKDINKAIMNMKRYNKNLEKNYKYTICQKDNQISLFFNEMEKEKLKTIKKITFISPSDRGYYSYKKLNENRGIDYDLAKLICEKLKVDFEYKIVDKYLNVGEIKALTGNTVICGNYYDMNWAEKNNLNLTAEFLKRKYYRIKKYNDSIYSQDNLKIAAVKNDNFTINYIERKYKDANIYYYKNIKECLDAVYLGECDITYCDSLIEKFYFNNYKYNKLFKEFISFENMSSFLLNENSSVFNSIINKTISSLRERDINQIVLNNLEYKTKNSKILNWIYLNSLEAFLAAIAIIFIILQLIYYYKMKRKNKLIKKVTALSKKDSMTKLYNRENFEKIVTQLLVSKSLSSKRAFVMMDIDSFKSINDNYGHMLGDKVIIKVTNLLKASFRTSDVLGRMGGDEFAIFLYDFDKKNFINSKIERLIKEINHCMLDEENEENRIIVKCSFGVKFIDGKENSFEKIYKSADEALYEAKSKGKNKYVISKH